MSNATEAAQVKVAEYANAAFAKQPSAAEGSKQKYSLHIATAAFVSAPLSNALSCGRLGVDGFRKRFEFHATVFSSHQALR